MILGEKYLGNLNHIFEIIEFQYHQNQNEKIVRVYDHNDQKFRSFLFNSFQKAINDKKFTLIN